MNINIFIVKNTPTNTGPLKTDSVLLEAYITQTDHPLTQEQKNEISDIEIDILFRGAKEYYKDIRMTRGELLE